ncbi:hypothetical protein LTR97_002769 [Elasticomyces elasticus]|uniref:Uncharacterized protein n=1 Tax=Elasticomyces elasticus TaxID=574655 RepID=A0AAN7VU28_9PEZI|nr:hypothetical protein LTR97_002769 [Elasticomyces elasticus]
MEPMETSLLAPTLMPNQDTQARLIHSYRLISKGYGGTYTLSKTATDSPIIPHIGTYGCFTTVGVYFAIDEQSCFAAHIDACVKHGREGVLFDQGIRSKAMKEQLSQIIHAALERESAERAWRMEGSEWLGRGVVVDCERTSDDEVGVLHWEEDSERGRQNNTLVSGVVADAVLSWVEEVKKKSQRRGALGTEMVFMRLTWRNGSAEAVLQKGGQSWRWVWDVSERTPSWKRTGM